MAGSGPSRATKVPQRIRRLSRSHRRKSWSLVCQRTRKVDGNLWTTQRKRLLVNSLYLNIPLHWAPNGPCWSIFVAWRNGRNARVQIHDTPLWKQLVLLFKMALLCRAASYTCSNSLSTAIWNAELEYWVFGVTKLHFLLFSHLLCTCTAFFFGRYSV